jgi:hypothetical protein
MGDVKAASIRRSEGARPLPRPADFIRPYGIVGWFSFWGWLFILALYLPIAPSGAAESPPPPAPSAPAVPTQSFPASFELVWEKLLVTLTSLELAPATTDKENGKLTTVPRRYFKIASAKFPPIQDDYRDTYDVLVEKQPDKTVKVQIKRKFEFYDRTQPPMGGWAQANPTGQKIGINEDEIFSALSLELAAAALQTTK